MVPVEVRILQHALPIHHAPGPQDAITTLILWMVIMTTNPVRPDRQRLSKVIQFPPEFLVLDRLVLRSFPAPGNPVVQPLGETIDNVLAVAVDIDDWSRHPGVAGPR